jgi:hypothetical protein
MSSHSRFSVRRWCVTLLGACAIQASAAEDAAAQVMQGSVIGANGEGPIATALVRLVDEDGEQVAITIADDRGRFRLEAPAPGSYRLQAERVGYRPAETPLLRATDPAGTFDVDLVMSVSPVEVEGVLVRVAEDQADRAVRRIIGVSPASLRFKPVRRASLESHVERAHTLGEVIRWEYAPALLVRETPDGPCFQYRTGSCLAVYLNGMRINRMLMPDVPLDMLYRVQVITSGDGSLAYPAGAVLLFTEAWLR